MDSPQIGIAVAVIRNETEVLFGYRLKPIGNKTWQLPGGHLEMYETFESCAKREIKEETGLEINKVKLVHVKNNPWPAHDAHYVTLFLTADYISGVAETPEEEKSKCGELRWCDIDGGIPLPLFEMDVATIFAIREDIQKRILQRQRNELMAAIEWVKDNGKFAKDTSISASQNYSITITVEAYGSESVGDIVEKLIKLGLKSEERVWGKTFYLPAPFADYFVSVEEAPFYEGCTT